MLDLAKRTGEPVAYAVSDLEVCYNTQLPNIGGAVEEHIGANRESTEHVTKVLPQCEHFL